MRTAIQRLRAWAGLATTITVIGMSGCGGFGSTLSIGNDSVPSLQAGGNDCANGPDFTGCPCTPGDTKVCYTGPSGTEGVGPCRAGTQTCTTSGELSSVFGPCTGEVVPSAADACTGATDGGTTVTVDSGGPDSAGACTKYACSGLHFAAPVTYPLGDYPVAVAVDDFNGDARPDLAVTVAPATNVAGAVDVLLNQGSGVFAAPASYAVGVYPSAVATGDLNGDGKVDLVVANNNSESLGILLNEGNGAFAPEVVYPLGFVAPDVVVADFDGDGKLDLATVELVTKGTAYPNEIVDVGLMLNKGNGVFASPVTYAAVPAWGGGFLENGLVTGDFNGDGKPDLAASLYLPGPGSQKNQVSVLLNQGHGTFGAPALYTVGVNQTAGGAAITSGDFDGNGMLDLATANYTDGTVSVLLNQGNGTFGAAATYPSGYEPDMLAAADFNGDCRPDLAVSAFDNTLNASAGLVNVLLDKGSGTFAAPLTVRMGDVSSLMVAVGDFNADGKSDFVVVNNPGPVLPDGGHGVSSVAVVRNDCTP